MKTRSLRSRAVIFGRLACVAATFSAAVMPAAEPDRPVIPDRVFDVTAPPFNARGDGETDNAPAIQAAIDAARAAGGGAVVVPPSAHPYLSGPVTLAAAIHLRVGSGAVLSALPYGRYPLDGARYRDFIRADRADDIEISGGGVIEGLGGPWWKAFEADEHMPHRPHLVRINRGARIHVHDITLKDSPMFHLVPDKCTHVTIERTTITCPDEPSHNTDGIDPAGSHFLIRDCAISVGDDNIAIKAGSEFCTDMTIRDCTFGTGHGLSIGGQSTKGLDGLVVERCTFTGTRSGLRMKADPTQGGLVQNVRYTGITMTGVQYPIVFYSYYKKVGNPGSGSHDAEEAARWNAEPPLPLATDTMPVWRNIVVDGLKVTGATGRSVIWGLPLPDAMLSAVTFNKVDYSGDRGFRIYNAHDIRFTGPVSVTATKGEAFETHNALAIVRQPGSQSAGAGASASFAIEMVGASGVDKSPPAIRWHRGETPLADGPQEDGTVVTGAATETLILSNIQPAAAGTYTAHASISLDVFDTAANTLAPSRHTITDRSDPATLTVGP
jgi:hypothetical protein